MLCARLLMDEPSAPPLTQPLVKPSEQERSDHQLQPETSGSHPRDTGPDNGAADEPEEDGDDCCIMCTPGMNAAVLALFRGDMGPARRRVSTALRDSLSVVTQFLDGLAIYALSKEWNDLFSIYVVGVQPLPFCKGTPGLKCTDPWKSGYQLVYAVVMLVIAACVQAVMARHESRFPSLATVRPMLGMVVGWALGDAYVEFLVEWQSDAGRACWWNSCVGAMAAFSTLVTLGNTVALVALQPLSRVVAARRCGKALEAQLAAFWQLLSRALSVTIYMLWNYSLAALVTSGINPSQEAQGGPLYQRVLVLWAATLHGLMALGVVQLQRWRSRLEQRSADLADAAAVSATTVTRVQRWRRRARRQPEGVATSEGRLAATDDVSVEAASGEAGSSSSNGAGTSTSDTAAPVVRDDAAAAASTSCAVEESAESSSSVPVVPPRLPLRLHRRAALLQLLSLLEATAGWVTGCAWTNAVTASFGTLQSPPTLEFTVTLSDAGLAVGLTLLAVVWLVVTTVATSGDGGGGVDGGAGTRGADGDDERRRAVERHFITNALAFFVGWTWVILLRDVTTLVATLGPTPGAWVYAREGASVVVFGPVLTLLLLRFKEASLRALDRGGGGEGQRETQTETPVTDLRGTMRGEYPALDE